MTKSWIVALGLLSSPAQADDADDHVARGESLAKLGEWTQAIDAFKAADARKPSATHACLIGLAYTRRELWPQAELFLARCRETATTADPAPVWVGDAETALATKIASSKAIPVTFQVGPRGAAATVVLSSFAPDEGFSPRMLHLAPGSYSIKVSAGGYEPRTETFEVIDRPLSITVDLQPVGATSRRTNRLWRYLAYAGAGVGVAGGLAHAFWAWPAARHARAATTNAEYEPLVETLSFRRQVTYVLYGVSAATLLTALVVRLTTGGARESGRAHIGARVDHASAMLTVEWTR